ncbi:MAG: MerR family transcriptional regulator [Thermodesulfobacteriota bacterium]
MQYLTIDELIKEAKKRKLDLGKDPEQIIRNFTKLGLIPKPKRRKAKTGKKATALYYPERTIEKLAHVKALKSEGLSLDEIRDSFALMYVQNALQDLLSNADDNKIKQLAKILSGDKKELESIVEAPLVYLIEGMSNEEAKKLLTLFCGVGFYAMLDAQKELENFNFNEARKNLFKAVFYNSISVLRLARTTGDDELEKTALEVYEKMVLKPLNRASGIVRKQFMDSLESYVEKKK